MGSTTPMVRPRRKWQVLFIAVILAAVAVFASVFAAAGSARAEESPDGQTVTDFVVKGFITFEEKPLEGVKLSIEGNGFSGETETDAEGAWTLYVPEKAEYTLTVDESTLPDGVIVADGAEKEVAFKLTNTVRINMFLGEGERVTESFTDQLLVRISNGLQFGLLLALAGIGAALIYGTTGLSNFAHGELVTWGAFVALVFTSFWSLPLWAGLIAGVIGGAALGLALDAGLWRPLRRRGLGVVQLMIVSIGLSLTLRYVIQFFIGGGTFQLEGANMAPMKFGPISLSWVDIISIIVCLVCIAAVAFFLTRTRLGKATRAISDNPQLAAASGINVDRVIRIVWVIAGMLAAVAGILWAYYRPGITWNMGTGMLLLIFSAITLGGLGTAFGALVGSLIIGLVVEVSTLFGVPSDLKYASALVVLIIILLVRPQGLLGRKERLG